MADFSINSVRERLFNPTKHEKVVARSSNPFVATSFKGNVLTADVFETASKTGMVQKLKSSALVGSLSNIGSKITSSIESVVAFGNRMKEGIVNGWNKLNSIEISIANPIKSMRESWDAMLDTKAVKTYSGYPISKLEDMFKGELGFVA